MNCLICLERDLLSGSLSKWRHLTDLTRDKDDERGWEEGERGKGREGFEGDREGGLIWGEWRGGLDEGEK